MGCQTSVILGNFLTFGICTHDPDTGELTDTDSAPAYRVYEDETAEPILTGTMGKLDDANTVGFYTERIACTSANGFEHGKTHTVYIEATVDGITGGISYAFVAKITLWIALTLQNRSSDLALDSRSLDLALQSRTLDLALQTRSLDLTLPVRNLNLTLRKKND